MSAVDYEKKVLMDPSEFVILADYEPSIIQEIRYHTTYNFIGDRIDGYEDPCAIVTKQTARALKQAASEANVLGYRLKVFDAYRPAMAVRHFVMWGIEDVDIRMKAYFYPDLEKQELFSKGYVAKQSSHSRGSTLDITLFDMAAGKELDMGSPFDFFGEVSHPTYQGEDITDEQYENRMLLQKIMTNCGFKPFDFEWWHFTLVDEPFPDLYFEFPVSVEYMKDPR